MRCKIIGIQPLCYAKRLILEDCEMINTDLSFEKSEVMATIHGNIMSVNNPKSGYIKARHIDEIILDEATNCEITVDSLINKDIYCESCHMCLG